MLLLYLSLIDNYDDKQKFESIYYAYRNLMYCAANSILNNPQDAEDAVQTAFIRIANHIKQVNEKECHKTKVFVVIVVERVAINMYNKKKKENHISYDEVSYDISTGRILEDIVSNSVLVTDVIKRIKELPVKYCDVLTLKYVYDLSGKEIAKIVGASHAAVRKRIERGLGMLNVKIREHRHV